MPFTSAQNMAIHALNPELLVSAAAGSGKTAVLIERILTLLRDCHYSLDRMLICTFTHAAAAEMRERLETRLSEAGISDKAMQKQADLVETAQISTLHAFCQKIIREHFEAVDIDPQASLCDEVTKARLKHAAMEQCLDEAYDQALLGTDENLISFLKRYSQNEIISLMDSLYEFLMAQPNPFTWLSHCAEHRYCAQDFLSGAMSETLLADGRLLLDGALSLWEDAHELCQKPHCRDGYAKIMQDDGELLFRLNAAAEESLSALIDEAAGLSFGRLPAYKLSDSAEIEVRDGFKALRDRYKKLTEEMRELLPADAAQALTDLNAMQPALMGLSQMTARMHTIFMEMKSERGFIDFSDLEHMALAILSKPDLQKKIASRFDAVFVDEYQDISAIQEAILSGLRRKDAEEGAKSSLRFNVGDVKQSIYRFRQADPTLFMEKEHTFSTLENAEKRKITLNHNFRSRESVLAAVNRAFSHIMRPTVTEIDYNEDARLHPGLPSQGDVPPEIHVIDPAGKKAADKPVAEAALIAAEINRRVGTPFLNREGKEDGFWHYRDMVVLLPAAKGIAPLVEKTLTDAGIPVYCEDGKGSMESVEIRQALAHLHLLDNVMDDLSLLAALRGPLYAMTEDELGRIRLSQPAPRTSFLSALSACAESTSDTALSNRCRAVLDDLTHERFLQKSMPLDEYLWSFLSRSGMYGFYGAQPGGRLRQANLRMLCCKAGEHIRTRGGDLRDFLSSVASVSGVRDSASPTILSPWEDVVRIMTIHKSKGLEFPLVFIMDLGGALHRQRTSGLIAMHPKLGVSLKYINPEARTKRGTLLGNAIALRQRAEEKAERARVLYVALTRAKDHFIAIGSGDCTALSSSSLKKIGRGAAYSIWEAKSMLEWLCQCIENTDDVRVSQDFSLSTQNLWETISDSLFPTDSTFFPQKTGVWRVVFHIDPEKSSLSQDMENASAQNAFTPAEHRQERIQALMQAIQQKEPSTPLHEPPFVPFAQKEIIDPVVPSLGFTHTPLKLGVTALLRSLSANAAPAPPIHDEEPENVEIKRLPLPFTKPKLLSDLPALPTYLRAPDVQTGLLRGVATHKALSLIPLSPLTACLRSADFSKASSLARLSDAISRELSLMQADGRITPEEFSRIDVKTLARFFADPLGQRVLNAQKIHREWHFNLRAPDLFEGLLQGVIDLCFWEDGGWVLVDYKTDHVQSTDELWSTYAPQLQIYRRALIAATRLPVKETALFSLSLGRAHLHS